MAPAVRWVAWAHPAPWVDRVALKWLVLLALLGKWVQAQVAFNLALADRQQVVLLALLRLRSRLRSGMGSAHSRRCEPRRRPSC